MKSTRRSSVRWRIVLIYFMLVLIAMTLVSVFMMNKIEEYQLSSLKENITGTITKGNLLSSLGRYDSLEQSAEEIQQFLDGSWTSGFSRELSIVSRNFKICATTSQNIAGRDAPEVFDTELILSSLLSGQEGESDSFAGEIPIKNYCYPILSQKDESITGVAYVRVDLSDIRSFLGQGRRLFVNGTAAALVITVILGFILASSITVPISQVTGTVQKMSQGDFSTEVPVKSNDEIGQLAEMFNLLRRKLDMTLSEINNEKNKLGTILEYMADGLIAVGLEGNIVQVNPAARNMLGLENKKDYSGLSYEDNIGKLSEILSLENIKNECEKKSAEAVFPYDGGVYVLKTDLYKDESGENVGIIIIIQDITERQRLQDMQSEFVANVSHELKTPLTNIKSYTETLLDGAKDDPEILTHFLSIVDREADRMNRLVKDLLQLSRLDHNNERIRLAEGNIIEVLNAAAEKMEVSAEKKDQTLRKDYDAESDIRVLFDKDRMEQVIINLLSNAVKYTPQGGIVSIFTDISDKKLVITVKDNGIGIPRESQSRIFERFYRVDKARSRAMGGTGLGLAITKQIVEAHSGSISVESNEGEGSTFSIYLPLYISEEKEN